MLILYEINVGIKDATAPTNSAIGNNHISCGNKVSCIELKESVFFIVKGRTSNIMRLIDNPKNVPNIDKIVAS